MGLSPEQLGAKFDAIANIMFAFDEMSVDSIADAVYLRIQDYLKGTYDFDALSEYTVAKKGNDKQWNDTGKTLSSLNKSVSGTTAKVEVSTAGALYTEYGKHNQPPRPVFGKTAANLRMALPVVLGVAIRSVLNTASLPIGTAALWKDKI